MKEQIRKEMDLIAPDRSRLIRNNSYYYERLLKFLTLNIPEGKTIIEIGCGNGYLFKHLKPSRAVGVDFSPVMIKCAREQNPEFEFYVMDAEELEIDEKFDFVIISDTIGYFEDVQKVLENVQKSVIPKPALSSLILIFSGYLFYLWQNFSDSR